MGPADSASSCLAKAVNLNTYYSGGWKKHTNIVVTEQKQLNTKHTEIWNAGLLADKVFTHNRNCGHLGDAEISRILQATMPWDAGHPALEEKK